MSTEVFLVLFALPLVTASVSTSRRPERYSNAYDQPFVFQCSRGSSISSIWSRHHNGAEDRQYGFSCRSTPGLGRCWWTGYLNNFDQIVLYQCRNGVISGMYSYHHNGAEDRRFKLYCCSLKRKKVRDCVFSGYANNWDAYFRYNVPRGRVLRGAFSQHDNGTEDRRWRFETCRIR